MADKQPKSKTPNQKAKGKHAHKMSKEKRKMTYKYQGKNDEAKERFKKKIIHDFNKFKRKPQPAGVDVQKLYEEMSDSDSDTEPKTSTATSQPVPKSATSPTKDRFNKKKEQSRFSRAEREFKNKADKKKQKYEEVVKKKREKEAALQQYRTKKKDRFLKLCKRTSKGQPVMKYQMQYLVEQLEREYEKEKKQKQQASTSDAT